MSGPGRTANARGRLLAAASGLGASLVPVGICPACWPALAGALGTFGLGTLVGRGLLPLVGVLLLVSLAALAYRASQRHGHGPLLLGAVGALALLVGRFQLASDALAYAGIAGLLTGAVWNAWPRASADTGRAGSCLRCAR